jgi:hypothetical protein
MPPESILRLAKYTGALLERTGVVVAMEVDGHETAPLKGYELHGDELRRDLVLPDGHAGRWAQFFWNYMAAGGKYNGHLYDSAGVLDFVTGARDKISFTAEPAPRQYSPAEPTALELGKTYELKQNDNAQLSVYGINDPLLCLTTPDTIHPLIVAPTVALMVEQHSTHIESYQAI